MRDRRCGWNLGSTLGRSLRQARARPPLSCRPALIVDRDTWRQARPRTVRFVVAPPGIRRPGGATPSAGRSVPLVVGGQNTSAQGVRRLMLAVLQDALSIIVRADRRSDSGLDSPSPRLLVEACEWVVANDATWPFSFLNVCGALEIDPVSLRRRLSPWLPWPGGHIGAQNRSGR
jgi:hypothetical protein